jgi:hypothetical protein
VNQLTPYELVIAEKVAQLPVVDMADSIWATIEQQLDMPLPGNEAPAQPTPGKGLPGPAMHFYFYILFTAVIVLLAVMLYKKDTTSNNVNNTQPVLITPPATPTEQPALTDSNQVQDPPKRQLPNLPQAGPAAIDSNTLRGSSLIVDSTMYLPPVILKDDSLTGRKDILIIPPVFRQPDSLGIGKPAGKKPKGVRGIGDTDYKIISKDADSLKRNN